MRPMSESRSSVPAAPATPRRPGGRRVLIAAGLAVLIAAGGTGWWLHSRGDGAPAAATAGPATRVACPTLGPDRAIGAVRGTPLLSSVFDGRLCVSLTGAEQGGAPDPSRPSYAAFLTSLRTSVLKSYVFDIIIAQEARIHHALPTQAQIDAEIAAQVEASGGQSQLDQQLKDAGGSRLTLDDGTRSRLNEADLVDQLARERAQDVIARLQAGTPFDQAARQFSDDKSTRDRGGALGKVTLDLLKGSDPTFQAAVLTMKPGELTTVPIHDSGGYEVVYLDAADAVSRTFHVIRIAAPRPYTVQERPGWFAEFIFLDIQGDCADNQITVTLAGLTSPCVAATASPSPGAAASATPSAAP